MKTLLNCAKGIRMFAIYGLTSILLTVGFTSCNLIPIVPPGSIKSADVNLNIHFSGDHIVDPDGNSLYLFSHDVKGDSSVCTGDSLAEWPAFFDPNYQVAPPLEAE